MKFVKCKNDREKLEAIKEYCNEKIAEFNRRINWFKVEQGSQFDYLEEIDELKFRVAFLEKIIEIANANEYTSIMLF